MKNPNKNNWKFWIDRGGTFTDIIAIDPNNKYHIHKLLSENPHYYKNAAIQGIRDILQLQNNEPIPNNIIHEIRMGTTIATNALLERKGEKTALLITKGHRDALKISYQQRPDIFALNIQKPPVLYHQVHEIEERIKADGKILIPLNEDKTRTVLTEIYTAGIRSIAIVLMHAYAFPHHEKRLTELAKETGFTNIVVSHEINPIIKLICRGDTTVADAYLSPILNQYTQSLLKHLGDVDLKFMQSNGGLCKANKFRGKDALLSGPAGGMVGAIETAKQAGFSKVIAFDMGGTSTDVSHFNGLYRYVQEKYLSGVFIRVPMLDIHTVAAGGGSICRFDGNRLRVGPESAGANPGPACYGNGGPLTVTDCNVMSGKIDPQFFPQVFGKNRNQTLDRNIVIAKFSQMCASIKATTHQHYTPEQLANGFLQIAIDNMVNAIKKISIQRGYDVKDYILNSFGGAGGQHACQVAETLGINKVLLHPLAGVLSAYGIGLSHIRSLQEKSVRMICEDNIQAFLEKSFEELRWQLTENVKQQGISEHHIEGFYLCYCRYDGSDTCIALPWQTPALMIEKFHTEHQQQFGFDLENKKIIIESISVEVVGKTPQQLFSPALTETPHATVTQEQICTPRSINVHFSNGIESTSVLQRTNLSPGNIINGPAIITESTSTIVVEPGWQGQLLTDGCLLLTHKYSQQTTNRQQFHISKLNNSDQPDPIMLEIFNNLMMSIAEEMGITLAKTAHSVNIKERLDFSCAVFNHSGELIANAPHVPVHLGSMSESVTAVITKFATTMEHGDVYLLNSPYQGGTHLPDLTIITPVYDVAKKSVIFYLASRAHHSDIGGIVPGSIPANSTHIDEEGLLIDGLKIVSKNIFLEETVTQLLSKGSYPARNILQNIADLQAQIAANNKGLKELIRVAHHYGMPMVNTYIQHIQDNAEECVRQAIAVLKNGSFNYLMDNGNQIQVAIAINHQQREAVIDFTGTSAQQQNNFNAPLAVCKAAVLYVFRSLVNDHIPLNHGCMKPLKIIVPSGSMLNPKYPAAVVAGNVETSQTIVDALYGALGNIAASQGTMNNFIFGNAQYQYYETICGGAGAGKNFHGCDAVHTHMTNSRLTDPEILEDRFPVLLKEFSIRHNSGGKGHYCGGNGVIRKILFLVPMQASVLSGHRNIPPFGLNNAESGEVGKNYLIKCDNTLVPIKACDTIQLNTGDTIVIETPGGGGANRD